MLRKLLGIVMLCCTRAALPRAQAQAAPDGTHVRVLDSWPGGQDVLLGRNQNFYLHLAFEAHQPTGLWVVPMYRGKPAHVGTSGSPMHNGNGEAVVWFFLLDPSAEVDEIRIQTGSGGPGQQPMISVWRGSVRSGGMTSDLPNPEWLDRLMPELAARAANSSNPGPPRPPRQESIAGVLLMVLFWLPGILVPLATAWFLRGGWRLALLVPAAVAGFGTAQFAVDVYRDATSHNLWPFELVMYTMASFIGTALILVIRALVHARRRSKLG